MHSGQDALQATLLLALVHDLLARSGEPLRDGGQNCSTVGKLRLDHCCLDFVMKGR